MAKLKMLKLPKKPKKSASVAVKENYLAKVREVQKENGRRVSENKKSDALSAKIAGIGSKTARAIAPKRRKKTTTTKKKRKTTKRKR